MGRASVPWFEMRDGVCGFTERPLQSQSENKNAAWAVHNNFISEILYLYFIKIIQIYYIIYFYFVISLFYILYKMQPHTVFIYVCVQHNYMLFPCCALLKCVCVGGGSYVKRFKEMRVQRWKPTVLLVMICFLTQECNSMWGKSRFFPFDCRCLLGTSYQPENIKQHRHTSLLVQNLHITRMIEIKKGVRTCFDFKIDDFDDLKYS